MSQRALLLAAVLLVVAAFGIAPPARAQSPQPPASAAPAGEPAGTAGKGDRHAAKPAELVAPDGILYDGEQSWDAMQMKALSDNLLANGSFEEGRYWPTGWQATDEFSTFVVSGGTDGYRCLRIYTDLLNDQWSKHDRAVRAAADGAAASSGVNAQDLPQDPRPRPPQRTPTAPPYLDTVAATYGVHYRSVYIPLKPGAVYRFSVDARSDVDGAPRVFVKGFFNQTMRTRNGYETVTRDSYRAPMNLKPCDTRWRRYARTFHPSKSKSTLDGAPLKTQFLQVQLYAAWKPGNYYFDNCRLEIVGYEEKEEPAPKTAVQPAAEPEAPAPPLGEDEFPVLNP